MLSLSQHFPQSVHLVTRQQASLKAEKTEFVLTASRQRLSSPSLTINDTRGGGGGVTPLWFLSRFGLKTGIDFDHYGLISGMVFKRTT